MRDGNARLGFRQQENGMGVSGGQRGKWPDARRQLDFSRPMRERKKEEKLRSPESVEISLCTLLETRFA